MLCKICITTSKLDKITDCHCCYGVLQSHTSGALYAGVVYFLMISSAAMMALVLSYTPAKVVVLPKSHSTQCPC